MDFWKGLLFTGGYLSVATVRAEAEQAARVESTGVKQEVGGIVLASPNSSAASAACA